MSRWYRAYEGTVTDGKLAEASIIADVSRSVAVATWHLLLEGAATKNNCGGYEVTPRRAAAALCEPVDRMEAVFAAFDEIGLTENSAIAAWQKRQYASGKTDGQPTETHVYFAGTEWTKAVKIGFSKNPWARAKELQTGNASKVEILAHFKCNAISERELHELLHDLRHAGEWFNLTDKITAVIQEAAEAGSTYEELVTKLRRSLRSATSPARKTETDKELSSDEDTASGDAPSLVPEHVFEGYQDLAGSIGLAVPRDFTPERRQLVRGRITQYPLTDFQSAFAKCRDSPFLRGDRGRTPLTFDWLMKKGNFQKVLEGNYDR